MSRMSQNNIDGLKKARDSIYKRIKFKEQGRFVDCCKEFEFIRPFDTYNFNQKMNAYGITNLVTYDGNPKKKNDVGYNLTDLIFNSIINPIKIDSNVVVGIIGYTGSGKSELAQLLSLIARQANKRYKNRDVEIYIKWTSEDLFNTLKILKKGDVVMKDEMPKAFGKGARIEKWSIENDLSIIRKMENTLIFCDPTDVKINICDMYLETAGMNLKTRTNRFMVLNKERQYFGHIYAKLHKDNEFRSIYKKEKDAFIAKSQKIAGKFSSGLNKDKSINTDLEDNKQSKVIVGKFPVKSIEYIREYLKEHTEGITTNEYKVKLNSSVEVARRFLEKQVDKKNLNFTLQARGEKVYYSRK